MKTMPKCQGAALIAVLFIVAVASVLAVQMSTKMQVQVQRTSNISQHQQAKWYALGAEALAKQVISESRKKDKDVVHLGQMWAQSGTTYPVELGTIGGEIKDLQACFNLNALRQQDATQSGGSGGRNQTNEAHKAFFELLKSIEDLPLEESEEALADSLFDWLDENDMTYRSGAEEDEYLSRDLPYLTANNYLTSVSELRLIKGFNPLVIKALTPYVCVIPNQELLQINVNTLMPEQAALLSALIPNLTKSDAQAVLAGRDEDGWEELSQFAADLNQQSGQTIDVKDTLFGIKSDFFELRAETTFAQSRFRLVSVLHVENNKINVLARKFGGVQ